MQETVHNDPAVNWLLQSDDPSIRYLTLTEVLGKSQDSPEVESAGKQIPQGPKVQLLLSGQMTDGGFGVHPYQKWTGAHWRLVSAEKAAEFFLKHRVYRSCRSEEVRQPETFHSKVYRSIHSFTELHYPLYWHYDILQALVMLQRADKLGDPRTKDAIDLVESKRQKDGLWKPEGYYWNLKRKNRAKLAVSNVEIVDWGRNEPNEMITLNALRILSATGRMK